MPTATEYVEAFKYSNDGDPRDGEIVQILSRVEDPVILDDFGPSFFVLFNDRKVGLAPARLLSPWFPL